MPHHPTLRRFAAAVARTLRAAAIAATGTALAATAAGARILRAAAIPATGTALVATAVLAGFTPGASSALAAPAPYTDQAQIPAWAAADVAFTTEAGIFRGDAHTGAFRPNDPITRAEATAVILRAFPRETDPTVRVPFSDLWGAWYEEPVTRAVRVGVIRAGDFGSRFRPNQPITRAELARMLARATGPCAGSAEESNVTFWDVDPEQLPFGPYIAQAAGCGLIRGMGDGTFAPEQTATRAQAAVMIARAVRVTRGVAVPAQPGPDPEKPAQGEPELHEFERRVAELVNAEREAAGLKPLRLDPELSRVARLKSRDFVTGGYFSHDSPTYGSPFEMMEQFGFTYRSAGENIALGQRTPEQVHAAWMSSPGHRRNIMDPNYDTIGIGFYDYGWTQMFIQSR